LAGAIAYLQDVRLNPVGLSTRESVLLLALWELRERRAAHETRRAQERLEMNERLKRARQWVADMRTQYPEGPKSVVNNVILALAEENERLEEALSRYGEHDEDCKAVDHNKLAVLESLCTCGLREVRAGGALTVLSPQAK